MNEKSSLDMPSFWTGVFVTILFFTVVIVMFTIDDIAAGRKYIVVPNCPAEDSCYPEYFQGEWYIIEGERP